MTRSLLGLLAAFALFATSCGGSSAESAVEVAQPDDATESSQAQSDPTAEPTAEPVAQASLVASTVDGGQIDFGSLQGQDVVLWYWAPW